MLKILKWFANNGEVAVVKGHTSDGQFQSGMGRQTALISILLDMKKNHTSTARTGDRQSHQFRLSKLFLLITMCAVYLCVARNIGLADFVIGFLVATVLLVGFCIFVASMIGGLTILTLVANTCCAVVRHHVPPAKEHSARENPTTVTHEIRIRPKCS